MKHVRIELNNVITRQEKNIMENAVSPMDETALRVREI